MSRKIIFYQHYFIEFYQEQDEEVKRKIQFVFELIKQVDRVPEKFLKHLSGTKGLFEIRIKHQSIILRIFCCFDEGKLVVLFNGFQKKTKKLHDKSWKKHKNSWKNILVKNQANGKV